MIGLMASVLMPTNVSAVKDCNEIDTYTLPDGTVVHVYECQFITDPSQVCPFAAEGTLCIIV